MVDATEEKPQVRRRISLSVRTRIVTVMTIATALGLLAVGVSVYLVERHRILEQVDERLQANLESARYIVAEGDGTGPWDSSKAALTAVVERMSPDDNTGAMGMTDGTITTVPGVTLDLNLRNEAEFARHVHTVTGTHSPRIGTYAEEGVVWRYLAAPIAVAESPDPAEVTFVLVYDLEAELAEFNEAARMFMLASALALLVVVATGTVVATRLLRPLRQMRETAERVSAKSLEERLPIVGNDDVAELAETMNHMFDRLDDALGSQRRLLSDVGHELKTPITIVRGHLEVMDADDAQDAKETRDLVVDELGRMARLVQDLADAAALHGTQPMRFESADIAELVQEIAKKAEGIDGAEVHLGTVAAGLVDIDRARITQAMLQLVQNAVTHGGGRIELGSSIQGGSLHMWVRDHGDGIGDDLKERVFDRFVRGEDSAARAGSGLGLNIVSMIARGHGGSAYVEDAEGGGARFVLTLPVLEAGRGMQAEGPVLPRAAQAGEAQAGETQAGAAQIVGD